MNREFVIRMFETVDARDWERLADFFHPDLVYHRPGYAPLVGRDAVLHFYREVRVIGSGGHQLAAVVVDGDHGACWGRFVGAQKDGTPVDVEFADCYGFQDGRLRARKSFFYLPYV